MITIHNTNKKNPNKLHDFLIANGLKPISLCHNAEYTESGEKIKEATEVYIEIEPEKEQMLVELVDEFMSP